MNEKSKQDRTMDAIAITKHQYKMLTLIEKGIDKVWKLEKETKLTRQTIYIHVNNLIDKGLLYKEGTSYYSHNKKVVIRTCREIRKKNSRNPKYMKLKDLLIS